MSRPSTIAEAFGPEIADRLARIAIDLACAAPARDGKTFAAKVPWTMVREARAIMDEAGIPWARLAREHEERERETRKANWEAAHR